MINIIVTHTHTRTQTLFKHFNRLIIIRYIWNVQKSFNRFREHRKKWKKKTDSKDKRTKWRERERERDIKKRKIVHHLYLNESEISLLFLLLHWRSVSFVLLFQPDDIWQQTNIVKKKYKQFKDSRLFYHLIYIIIIIVYDVIEK